MTFFLVKLSEGYWHLVSRGQDYCQISCTGQPHNFVAPNIDNVVVEKPWSRGILRLTTQENIEAGSFWTQQSLSSSTSYHPKAIPAVGLHSHRIGHSRCLLLPVAFLVCEDSGSDAYTDSDGTEKANVKSRVPNTTSLLHSHKLRHLNTSRIPHPQLRVYRSSPH